MNEWMNKRTYGKTPIAYKWFDGNLMLMLSMTFVINSNLLAQIYCERSDIRSDAPWITFSFILLYIAIINKRVISYSFCVQCMVSHLHSLSLSLSLSRIRSLWPSLFGTAETRVSAFIVSGCVRFPHFGHMQFGVCNVELIISNAVLVIVILRRRHHRHRRGRCRCRRHRLAFVSTNFAYFNSSTISCPLFVHFGWCVWIWICDLDMFMP